VDILCERRDRCVIGEVEGTREMDRRAASRDLLDSRLEARFVDVGHHQLGALSGGTQRGRVSDT
jgi:hypothetical protein